MWTPRLRKSLPSHLIYFRVKLGSRYVPVHLEYILTEILKNSFRATVEHHHSTHGNSSRVPIPDITLTIAPPTRVQGDDRSAYLSIRVRDEGGGISAKNMERIFSYAFTTAGRNASNRKQEDAKSTDDDGMGGGPYAAQYVGGMAGIDGFSGDGDGNLFGEITGKGLQSGLGTIAGLGYGLAPPNSCGILALTPVSRLPMAKIYASYFSGSLQLISLYGHGTDCFLKLRCLDDGGEIQI